MLPSRLRGKSCCHVQYFCIWGEGGCPKRKTGTRIRQPGIKMESWFSSSHGKNSNPLQISSISFQSKKRVQRKKSMKFDMHKRVSIT
jgi:hypothetical protein